MLDITPNEQSSGMRAKIQAFGGFLTNMVLPNIGAFIAWGILTALVIETGWLPNEELATIVGPAINYLLPLLLGYTGGKMVGGRRGAVIGAVATFGLIVGADIPMFLGAMIMGPFAGWVIKKFDNSIHGKVPAGFEMIVNNFSLGILGFFLMILSFWITGPAIQLANNVVKSGIQILIDTGFLPLLSL
ncbi:MAG: PTS transporter subunit EIIC, partial [bacterium]